MIIRRDAVSKAALLTIANVLDSMGIEVIGIVGSEGSWSVWGRVSDEKAESVKLLDMKLRAIGLPSWERKD